MMLLGMFVVCCCVDIYIYIYGGDMFQWFKDCVVFCAWFSLMNQEAFSSRVSLVAAHSVVPVYIYIYHLCVLLH